MKTTRTAPRHRLEALLTGHFDVALTGLLIVLTRWMLALLRSRPVASDDAGKPESLADALPGAAGSLESRGFTVTPIVSGPADMVPTALVPTLVAVMGEATSNIENHGDPSEPCAIVIDVADHEIERAFLNIIAEHPGDGNDGWGLRGVRERLAIVDGSIEATRKGQQWITHVRVPT